MYIYACMSINRCAHMYACWCVCVCVYTCVISVYICMAQCLHVCGHIKKSPTTLASHQKVAVKINVYTKCY